MKVSDHEIVAAILSSRTNKAAAESLELSERQIQERIRSDSFQTLYLRTLNDMTNQASAIARAKLSESVLVLSEIMNDRKCDPKIRVSAANTLLSNAARLVALSTLDRRQEEEFEDPLSFRNLLK